MPFSSAVGTVAVPTVPGEYSVTGLTFTPKIVMLFYSGQGAAGAGINLGVGFGAATSTTSRFAVWAVDSDASASSSSGRYHTNAKIHLGTDAVPTVTLFSDFVSFNSDGFTLNLEDADGTARILNYIALGGSTLTNVAIKEFTTPGTGAQTVAYTGVGFQPDAIMFFSVFGTGAPPAGVGTCWFSAGFSSATNANGVVNVRSDDNEGAGDTSHGQSAAAVLLAQNPTGTVEQKASVSAFGSDGFSLTYTASAFAGYVWAICLKGGNYKVGEITQKTSTGTQAYTGVGFKPSAVMLLSTNDASNSDSEAQNKISIGAASSALQQASIWGGAVDAVDPTQVDQYQDATSVIRMMTAGTPTTEAVATFVSKQNDGFTLDWTTADATARTIEYLAFGPDQGGGAGGPGSGKPRPPGGRPPGGGGSLTGPVLKKLRFPEKVI